MSRPRADLSLSLAAVNTYIKYLGGMAFVDAIYINGSRSPVSPRVARDDSDWDFIAVVSTNGPVKMKGPRDSHKLHADTIYIKSTQLEHYTQAAMIWPVDEYGVLTDG